jgi:hypothetical protein
LLEEVVEWFEPTDVGVSEQAPNFFVNPEA